MRKFFPLFIILAVLLMSSFVLADEVAPLSSTPYDEHVNDDGIITREKTGAGYVVLDYIENRSGGYYADANDGNGQSTNLTIRTEAYIPCYIEMSVVGNMGNSVLKSFGPGAHALDTADEYFLLFDNEVGGFVNGSWEELGHGRNAEVEPGDNVFIQACDQLKVNIYANDTYKYDVIAAALKASSNVDTEVASDLLPLHMRTKVDTGAWGGTFLFDTEATKTAHIAQRYATQSLEVYHHFRVPYTRSTAHGRYDGTVVLKAYTI